MTVADLILELQKLPPDSEVWNYGADNNMGAKLDVIDPPTDDDHRVWVL